MTKILISNDCMPKIVLMLFSLFFFHQTNCIQPSNNSNIDFEELDEYITQCMKDWKVPGLSISVVNKDSILFSKGYGKREILKEEAVNEHTIFAIASNTKAFTSGAIARLVDEDLLEWDDRVTKYLPSLQLYNPFVSNNVTIRDLLCHRVGLTTFSGDLLWYGTIYNRDEIIQRIKYLNPTYDFRAGYGYSNLMFLVAGEIIPEVTGISWDDYIKHNFFESLGMNSSFTSVNEIKTAENIARPHFVDPEGNIFVIPYVNWDNIGPAGSILSTAEDMSQWLMLQLNRGKYNELQIISEEGIHEMHSLHTPLKLRQYQEYYWPGTHFNGFGLGWKVFDYNGKKIINHGGAADGMISEVTIVPEENIAFVILTNSNNYLTAVLHYYLLDEITDHKKYNWNQVFLDFKHSHDNHVKKEWNHFLGTKIENTSPSLPLQKYTGTYRCEMYGDISVENTKNHLVMHFNPTPMLIGELIHFHYNTFLIRLRNYPSLPEGMVNFILNEFGEVERLKIEIPNPDFDFTELQPVKIDD